VAGLQAESSSRGTSGKSTGASVDWGARFVNGEHSGSVVGPKMSVMKESIGVRFESGLYARAMRYAWMDVGCRQAIAEGETSNSFNHGDKETPSFICAEACCLRAHANLPSFGIGSIPLSVWHCSLPFRAMSLQWAASLSGREQCRVRDFFLLPSSLRKHEWGSRSE
jgi:hypothetical protein